jgi:type IV pilus assembly protein PilW
MKSAFQKGFTILEILISLVIGMIVVAAVMSLFVITKRIYLFQKNFGELQEDVRFLSAYIPRIVRLAGHRTPRTNAEFIPHENVFETTPFIQGKNGNNSESDSITISYQGSSDPTGQADGKVRDCLNQYVKADTIVTNKFYVEKGELKCSVNNPGAPIPIKTETIMSGVENFQIQYGEDLFNDGVPNRYVNAAYPGLNMNRVTTVKIGFLLKSSESANIAPDSKKYTVLDLKDYQPGGSKGDLYIRVPITFTVVLRNLIPG